MSSIVVSHTSVSFKKKIEPTEKNVHDLQEWEQDRLIYSYVYSLGQPQTITLETVNATEKQKESSFN